MGVATNIVATRPTLSSVSKQQYSHYHPADSVFDTTCNVLLSHAFCPNLCRYGLVTKKIASACIDYIIAYAAVSRPRLNAVTKFKTTKINFEGLFGLSMKIRPRENYPPYGMMYYTYAVDMQVI